SPCRRLCGLLFLGVGTGHFAKVEARTVLAQDYRATEGSEVECEEHNLQRCVRGKASLEYDDWHEAGSQEEGNAEQNFAPEYDARNCLVADAPVDHTGNPACENCERQEDRHYRECRVEGLLK